MSGYEVNLTPSAVDLPLVRPDMVKLAMTMRV